jgi:hypothetical protein
LYVFLEDVSFFHDEAVGWSENRLIDLPLPPVD